MMQEWADYLDQLKADGGDTSSWGVPVNTVTLQPAFEVK